MKYLAILVSATMCGFITTAVAAKTISHDKMIKSDTGLIKLPEHSNLVSLNDEELSQTQGQALFNLQYLRPGDSTNYYNSSNGNIGFYTLGMEAEVSLNANIRNLQLGCGGVNGANGCDVEIQNFSLGCIANASGTCISLPTTTVGSASNTARHTTSSSTVADVLSNQQQLKDFVLTNPFYQFAIRNPESASTREVVGLRIGAAHAKGPMSFNDIITFSGYLSGTADITMQKKNNLAFTKDSDYIDSAGERSTAFPIYPDPNWPGPGPGTCTGGGTSGSGLRCATGTLGLSNWDIVNILGIKVQGKEVLANLSSDVERQWAVSGAGNRFGSAFIRNANLASVVDEVVDSVNNITTSTWIPDLITEALFPALKNDVKAKVKEQLASGLGISTSQLSNFDLKYNLSNVGSLDIDSPAFGITLQKEALFYPGYVEYNANKQATTTPVAMPRGWAMYLPAAFTLDIKQPLDMFTSTILGGSAAAGNIVGLPAPYRNCYGDLTFC